MAGFLIYIIRWTVVLTLLYSLYGLFLRRETFHGVNRAMLLAILIGSMLMPFYEVNTSHQNILNRGVEQAEMTVTDSMEVMTWVATEASSEIGGVSLFTMMIWAVCAIYLIGLLFFWLRYIVALFATIHLVMEGTLVQTECAPKFVKILINSKISIPCSWMRWVMVNPSDAHNAPIIAHELAHIRLLHSLDALLADLTVNMLWFLPFSWTLRKDLKDIHEYQADQHVIKEGYNEDDYQMLLIDRVTSVASPPIMNAMNQSSVKKRLKMMFRRKSSRMALMKVAYLLPLVAVSLSLFARPTAVWEVEASIHEAEAKAYQIVNKAPDYIPKEEPLVVDSVPPSPYAYTDYKVAESQHMYVRMISGSSILRGFNLRRVGGETYMQVFGTIEHDSEGILIADVDTYIVDVSTGIRYKARRVLPPGIMNRWLIVNGCKMKSFMYTIVFPNLPRGFYDARIYGVPYCDLRGAYIHNLTQYFDDTSND